MTKCDNKFCGHGTNYVLRTVAAQTPCAYIVITPLASESGGEFSWGDLGKPQPRERSWDNQRGKKTLMSLTLVRLCEMI